MKIRSGSKGIKVPDRVCNPQQHIIGNSIFYFQSSWCTEDFQNSAVDLTNSFLRSKEPDGSLTTASGMACHLAGCLILEGGANLKVP